MVSICINFLEKNLEGFKIVLHVLCMYICLVNLHSFIGQKGLVLIKIRDSATEAKDSPSCIVFHKVKSFFSVPVPVCRSLSVHPLLHFDQDIPF